MNDQDLKTAVRDGLAGVHMRTPAADVLARGRALRARRRSLLAVGTISVAAAAVTGVLAASAPHPAGHDAVARASTTPSVAPSISASLTAWSVTSTGGSVKVTIRQMINPQGLQAKLRADGVRVVVTPSLAWPAACHEWRGGHYRMGSNLIRLQDRSGLPSPGGTEFVLDPSQIPSGALLWLGLPPTGKPSGVVGPPGPMGSGLFAATQACLNS